METETKTIHKAFSSDITLGDEERTVVARISTAAVDRDGESLIPQGMNSKNYQLNPVICLSHDYYTLPIGKCVALKREDDAIIAKIQFAERPEGHPEGEEWIPGTVFSLYKQGVMRAFSVGLMPIETRAATPADIEKRGANLKRVVSKWELLEVSAVALPANQEAVAMAVSKGWVKAETAEKLFGEIPELPELPAETVTITEPIIEVPIKNYAYYFFKPEPVSETKSIANEQLQKMRGHLYVV